ncbi:co-chaperone YbbN [Streptomonospora nanhaiensis]|uniref:Putative thioredoxin n=1 Tax=Streptomonospora nanhaiensis TaxID=1323731 RepID=A0A853BLH8_9ACTN|nr:tetratricopeptide repeat protein [Streptomonospora nanhaiensis]MBV2366659.1 tetratricopeptide repeat protein [Streptomonospora nanhaiensis]MBX9389217.1 tetratricopeptide repeat protein [Streptomonospora nanhaiensis]NYI95840.1 putative thioredoxin [Streptomonospora nanhaiensis]
MQPSDYSMQGAVDLGARKAALEREAKRQAEASSGHANPYAIDISEENFQQEVLERSMSAPVILAVLQTRSEQSNQVEKALDRLAVEAGGQWAVAKVDVQASPQIAQALRVPGVPMVAMVIGGQVVPGPVGPANYDQLRDWLGQVFDGLRQQGILPQEYAGLGPQGEAGEEQAAGPAGGGDPADVEAQEALQRGDFAAAEAVYAKAVEADPKNDEAKSKLAQVRLLTRVHALDANAARKAAADDPQDVEAQINVADIDMYGGKIEDAFDRLIATVKRTSEDDRDRARKHLLSLFEILPPGDPRVGKARRALTSALF